MSSFSTIHSDFFLNMYSKILFILCRIFQKCSRLPSEQCFGSGFVFYGSGSWIFPPIWIQATKNKLFQNKNKILGNFFVFNPKSRYFIFVFNQSSRYFIKQNIYLVIIYQKISECGAELWHVFKVPSSGLYVMCTVRQVRR